MKDEQFSNKISNIFDFLPSIKNSHFHHFDHQTDLFSQTEKLFINDSVWDRTSEVKTDLNFNTNTDYWFSKNKLTNFRSKLEELERKRNLIQEDSLSALRTSIAIVDHLEPYEPPFDQIDFNDLTFGEFLNLKFPEFNIDNLKFDKSNSEVFNISKDQLQALLLAVSNIIKSPELILKIEDFEKISKKIDQLKNVIVNIQRKISCAHQSNDIRKFLRQFLKELIRSNFDEEDIRSIAILTKFNKSNVIKNEKYRTYKFNRLAA